MMLIAAGYEDGGYEWETTHTEAPDQILFDTVGDTYIGRYIAHEIIYPDPEKKPTEWFVPWLPKVLPNVLEIAGRHPERTIFTRFIPPQDPEHADGAWRSPHGEPREEQRKRQRYGSRNPLAARGALVVWRDRGGVRRAYADRNAFLGGERLWQIDPRTRRSKWKIV